MHEMALRVLRPRRRAALLHNPNTFLGRREKYLRELRKLREEGIEQF